MAPLSLEDRARGLRSAALSYVLEPPREEPKAPPEARRPVIAVAGLAPRCGTTTVARGLAAALAARDECGACVVTGAPPGGLLLLGNRAARALARELSAAVGRRPRAIGRLCLVAGVEPARLADAGSLLAPVVIDIAAAEPPGPCAALADAVVLVADRGAEPALATAAAASLARLGPEPWIVANRVSAEGRSWSGRAHATLPDSRAGARLATTGSGLTAPRAGAYGALGVAFAEFAARVAP